MRSIKKIHKAEYRPVADLVTYTPMPRGFLESIDPFLFINHHGPQKYPADNNGLPFGPHPHRGMETVTFILDGDIDHKDSGGHESVITAGGIQWMTAGSGLIHAEVSSEKFKKEGGNLEVLQLWINLPAKHKMTKPKYSGLQKDEIPEIELDNKRVIIHAVCGAWAGQKGAFTTLSDIALSIIDFKTGGQFNTNIKTDRNIFFYLVRGELLVNKTKVEKLQLVEFDNDAREIEMSALKNSVLILGHAVPFNEEVVAHGPFVMNTAQEIEQAYLDYKNGKFGSWN